MSGMGVGDVACTEVQIIDDSVLEEEEFFLIALQSNDIVLVVEPDVSTVVIGEPKCCNYDVIFTTPFTSVECFTSLVPPKRVLY